METHYLDNPEVWRTAFAAGRADGLSTLPFLVVICSFGLLFLAGVVMHGLTSGRWLQKEYYATFANSAGEPDRIHVWGHNARQARLRAIRQLRTRFLTEQFSMGGLYYIPGT